MGPLLSCAMDLPRSWQYRTSSGRPYPAIWHLFVRKTMLPRALKPRQRLPRQGLVVCVSRQGIAGIHCDLTRRSALCYVQETKKSICLSDNQKNGFNNDTLAQNLLHKNSLTSEDEVLRYYPGAHNQVFVHLTAAPFDRCLVISLNSELKLS